MIRFTTFMWPAGKNDLRNCQMSMMSPLRMSMPGFMLLR